MSLPVEEVELKALVEGLRLEVSDLERRTRAGEGRAFKSLKIVRRRLHDVESELWQELRHARDDARRDLLEAVLGKRRG